MTKCTVQFMVAVPRQTDSGGHLGPVVNTIMLFDSYAHGQPWTLNGTAVPADDVKGLIAWLRAVSLQVKLGRSCCRDCADAARCLRSACRAGDGLPEDRPRVDEGMEFPVFPARVRAFGQVAQEALVDLSARQRRADSTNAAATKAAHGINANKVTGR